MTIRKAMTTAAAAVTLLALSLLPFWQAVSGRGVLFRRDIGIVWYPLVASFVRCAAEGSWPLWDAYRGFGQPLLADPRAEVLYPPTWLNLAMSPGAYYTLFVVAHLAFSGFGLYLLARRWNMSPLGAFGGASAWLLSGPLLSLASMWHHLAGAAWIPWAFWATDRALERRGALPLVGLGLVMAAQVLTGSPDYTALTVLALAAYVASCHWRWRDTLGAENLRVAWRLALAAVLALLVSAGQWIPTLDVASRSERTSLSFEEAAVWSLHPATIVEAVLPWRWSALPLRQEVSAEILEGREPWLSSIYLGAIGLALAACGLLASASPRRRFLAGLAATAALVALGKHGAVFYVGRLLLPPLGMLRFPVKVMVLVAFAAAALAGLGIDALRATAAGDPRLRRAQAASFAVFVAAVVAWSLARDPESWAPALLSRAATWPGFTALLAPTAANLARAAALAGGLTLLALARSRVSPRVLAAGAVSLLCLDLLVAHVDLHPVAPAEIFSHRPEALSHLDPSPEARLYSYDYSILTRSQRGQGATLASSYRLARRPAGWSADAALVLGAEMSLIPPTAGRWRRAGSYDADILGFYPPELSRLVDLLRASEATPLHLRLLRMGAVRDVVALRPAAWWKELEPTATIPGLFELPIRVFKVPETLPRAYVVGGVRSAEGPSALAVLADRSFDPSREVILATPAHPSDDGGGWARVLKRRSDRVVIEAQLPREGYVVLVDAFDPGWRGWVDGTEETVQLANLAFEAVAAPAGTHRIELLYRPRPVILGLTLSATGLLASVLLAASAWRRPS